MFRGKEKQAVEKEMESCKQQPNCAGLQRKRWRSIPIKNQPNALTFSTTSTVSHRRRLRHTPSLSPHPPPPHTHPHTSPQECQQRIQSIHRNADHTTEAIVLSKKKPKRDSFIKAAADGCSAEGYSMRQATGWHPQHRQCSLPAALKVPFKSSAFHRQTLCRESLGLIRQL